MRIPIILCDHGSKGRRRKRGREIIEKHGLPAAEL
jgi:hypothetical protein